MRADPPRTTGGRHHYEIVVAGGYGSMIEAALPDFEVTPVRGGIVHLSGSVVDQAALHAALLRLQDLHLEVLEVAPTQRSLSFGSARPRSPNGHIGTPCRVRRSSSMSAREREGDEQTRASLGSVVRRSRLVRILDEVPSGGIGLIVAGAGTGKTMLIAEWMRERDAVCVSIGLDSEDCDPAVFARNLVAAIDSRVDGFADEFAGLSTAGTGIPGRRFAARLVVAIEELDYEFVIAVDDVQFIERSGESMAILDELVSRTPDNLRLIVAARRDAPLTLHQQRLDGRLIEIRGAELAFDLDETRSLVEAVACVVLDDPTIATLHQRTDGWAVGIRLAAISIKHSNDVDRFVADFRGSDALVAQYLTREVLDALGPAIRRFMMTTSVLPWLSSDLCGAVVDDMTASEIEAVLNDLERNQLFMTSTGVIDRRFRYHHLFAELLLYTLRHDEPHREHELRRRAALHLAERGEVAPAIAQFLEIGDVDGVLEMVVAHGRPIYERNESATLARWLGAARSLTNDAPAELDIQLLGARIAALDSTRAVETYRAVRRRNDLSVGQRASGEALYGLLGMDDLPPGEVERAANEALDLLASAQDANLVDVLGIGGRPTIELFARFMLGLAAFHRGDLQCAIERFDDVLELEGMQYPVWKVYTLGALGLVHGWNGDLVLAESLATRAVELGEHASLEGHVGLAFAHHALARVALERVDLGRAAEHLSLAQPAVEQSRRAALLSMQRLLGAIRLSLADGSRSAAAELDASPPPALAPAFIAGAERKLLVRLRIATGNWLAAGDLIAEEPSVGGSERFDLALARGDLEEAAAVLDAWVPEPAHPRAALESLIRRAVLLAAQGSRGEALATLADALMRAEPAAQRLPFVNVPAVVSLLKSDVRLATRPFAASIVATADAVADRAESHQRLVEPLTNRERDVLALLPTRLTNAEMAASLYVSVNTLKTHVRHIYLKLDAVDRDHAVERAARLGIL